MPPLAEQNNNPGDLRFAGQSGATQGKGGFAAFATPQAGASALLNQIQMNVNKSPNENLIDFASKYAPASDGNDVGQYVSNIANELKVNPLTPISKMGRMDCYFCPNQRESQALKVAEHYPNLAQEWMAAEERKGHSFMTVPLKVLIDYAGRQGNLFAESPFKCSCFGGNDDATGESNEA